jgi:cell division protein FtsW (lipid II flippase)
LWHPWIGFTVWLAGFGIVTWQADRLIPERDPYLLPIIGLMSGWGMLTLFRLDPAYGFKQTIWLGVCLLGLTAGLHFKGLLNILRRYKYIWLTLVLGLTLLTFFFGTNPGGSGPNLWLGLGGIYLQPSELLKLVLVIYLAAYLADSVPAKFKFLHLLTPTLLVAGAALLILIVQRDLGTASLFIALYTVIIYLASGKRRFLLISFLIIVAALIAGYFIFDVIQLRVEAWLNPWLDPNGRSYQIVQSIISIANGGILGRGIGLGSPGVVPVAQSDFIFPSIVEETGLVGGIAIVLLYAVITLRGFTISLQAPNQFQRFLAAGVTTYLVSQALLIMGGTIRLLPLTGVTLPFFSYGGSSLITAFFAALLLLIISNHPADQSISILQSKAYFFIGSAFLAALLAVALVTSWWSVFRADTLLARNDNPRRFISDQYVQRGKIFDRNNTVLAETTGETGNLIRVLHYPTLSAVVGYSDPNYGQGGLEASLDSVLRGVEGNSAITVLEDRLLFAQYPIGADVRLSLDIKLQLAADTLMARKTGALVMLNAKTGEILVMSTSPTFDANTLKKNWDTRKSSPSSPLLNRVTQGEYPPGTATGGILLARLLASSLLPPSPAAVIWSTNPSDPLFCAKNPGTEPEWGSLISAGCNSSFKMLDYYLGKDEINAYYQQLGLLTQPDLSIAENGPELSTKTTNLNQLNNQNSAFLVSPLQMAIAYATLSNGGKIVTPRLATAYRYAENDWTLFPTENLSSTAPSIDAIQTGSALTGASIPGWQVTSLALTDSGRLDWFIAGTQPDWKGTPIVIVVALEDSSPQTVEYIGREMFNSTVNSIK